MMCQGDTNVVSDSYTQKQRYYIVSGEQLYNIDDIFMKVIDYKKLQTYFVFEEDKKTFSLCTKFHLFVLSEN